MRIGSASVCRRACIRDARTRTQGLRRGPCSRPCNNRRNIPCPPEQDKSRSCARIFSHGFQHYVWHDLWFYGTPARRSERLHVWSTVAARGVASNFMFVICHRLR